ncbi:hypothetical protein [uncultured Chitinophaga sp.]|jgi:hypothetical protein|uniref:hypothetical protein n=1 Tax=uncultured Chitinophaga sp. TaxID=339340 RepID=UPI00262EEBF3|nr:hypothetical protein [uncultured Chitinophaga sp.]
MQLKNFTDEQLKSELAKRGYCTSALWRIEDVHHAVSRYNKHEGTAYMISDDDAIQILDGLFGTDAELSPERKMLDYAVANHFLNNN